MHNNYYLIRQLVPELKHILRGAALTDCFSQQKDELVLQFATGQKQTFNLLAHLTNQFTCLAFPPTYRKARKNTASVFPELLGHTVNSVTGFANERAFIVGFSDDYALLFKLFGHQANVLLLKNNAVVALFKNNLSKDLTIDSTSLSRSITQDKAAVLADLPELKNVYPTLDRNTRSLIAEEIAGLEPEVAYVEVKKIISRLENPKRYYIINRNHKPALTLLPEGEPLATFNSPLPALTYFFKQYMRTGNYQQIQQGLLKDFTARANKTIAYLQKTRRKLAELQQGTGYQQQADILMANLHAIPANSKSVTLADFYTGNPVTIKLNPRLNAQQNAERYYRKAKNVSKEISQIEETIAAKEKLLAQLEQDIEKLSQASSLDDLKPFIKTQKQVAGSGPVPFKQFIIDGFTVLVGKNAKQNDLLTLKYAKKDDLFFHAKDVAGSHVILKQQSGSNFPEHTLEKVAALAAWYSKRKTDSLCPVGYTAKKYVRKPKGAAPGLVLVEKEKVLLVKPELPG